MVKRQRKLITIICKPKHVGIVADVVVDVKSVTEQLDGYVLRFAVVD